MLQFYNSRSMQPVLVLQRVRMTKSKVSFSYESKKRVAMSPHQQFHIETVYLCDFLTIQLSRDMKLKESLHQFDNISDTLNIALSSP